MSTITSSSSASTTSSDLTSRLRTFSFSEKTTVVLEFGFRFTKVGFAGEAKPRSVVPTKVPSQTGVLHEKAKNIMEIENEAELRFALIDFINQLFIRHILLTPKDKTVIIAEPLFLPLWFRKTLLNVLFCEIQIASVFIAPGPLFALFGLGWRSGLVVDVDAFEASVFPVYENVAILKAVESAPIGYFHVVEQIRSKLVEEHGWPKQELEGNNALMDDIITSTACFVDRFDRVEARRAGNEPPLKTGDTAYPSTFGGKYPPFTVPGCVRESAGEPLVDPDADDGSIPQLILHALERCPIDVRRLLADRIVLIGCCTTLPGFGHRVCAELQAAVSRGEFGGRRLSSNVASVSSFKIAQPPVPSENLTWFGASIFGNLEVAVQRAVTRDKYFTELKIMGNTDFTCSKVLTADWLNTPSLIPYPGQEINVSLTDATSSSC